MRKKRAYRSSLGIDWNDSRQRNAYHAEKARIYRSRPGALAVYPLIFGILIGREWRALVQTHLK